MKKIFTICLPFLCFSCQAQTPVPSYFLSVTLQKTTNLIFPYRINKADIGSGDVIGQKDPRLGNVLFLKANRKDFAPTNLSIYTSDGKFYSFIVRYKADPDTLNLAFAGEQVTGRIRDDGYSESLNEARLDSDARLILNLPAFMHRNNKNLEIKLTLKSIYVRDQLLWFQFLLKNQSEIIFYPEFIRFFIRDKHMTKRMAAQEEELTPLWQTRDLKVSGQGTSTLLFAFPAFTLARQKKMFIQVNEKYGGRILTLVIPPILLLKSRSIP
jgi:conjugative transposon TraN protein